MNHTLDGPDLRWQRTLEERAASATAGRMVLSHEAPERLALSRGILFGISFSAAIVGGIAAIVLLRALHWI